MGRQESPKPEKGGQEEGTKDWDSRVLASGLCLHESQKDTEQPLPAHSLSCCYRLISLNHSLPICSTLYLQMQKKKKKKANLQWHHKKGK